MMSDRTSGVDDFRSATSSKRRMAPLPFGQNTSSPRHRKVFYRRSSGRRIIVSDCFRSSPTSFQRTWLESAETYLLSAGLRRAGSSRIIQESCRAIDAVTLRIAYPFYDIRTFQSFDGALRGRKRDRQFVRHAFCSDERICPQEFDHTQRVVA